MLDSRLSILFVMLSPPAAVGEPQDRANPTPKERATIVRARPPIGSIIIQQRMVIRVPRLTVGRASMPTGAPLPPIKWVEKKADTCIPATSLAGAAITRADSVDLVLTGGKRLRARLESDCPALGFYDGFYVKPTGDGRVCARRDTIRSRSGGVCRIESFRALVPGR